MITNVTQKSSVNSFSNLHLPLSGRMLPPLFRKVVNITQSYSPLFQPVLDAAMGSLEIWDGLCCYKKINEQKEKIKNLSNRIFNYYSNNASFYIIRGSLTICTGIFGGMRILKKVITNSPLPVGGGWLLTTIKLLTLLSHFMTLGHSGENYRKAEQLMNPPYTTRERLVSSRARQSAVLGIVSSVSYLFSITLPLIISITALTLFLEGFSFVSRYINSYFDYIYVKQLPPIKDHPHSSKGVDEKKLDETILIHHVSSLV